MKKLIQFVKDSSVAQAVIVVVLLVVCVLAISALVGGIGSSINESRINKLETEKQQALKRANDAHSQNLILQGQVIAKDEQIQNLTSQIADSNSKVSNAHNETQSARQNLNQVRTAKPHFNSTDDAGRVVELGTNLHGLYPDSP
jgi:hypothetical protein